MTSDVRTGDDFLLSIARAREAFDSVGRAASRFEFTDVLTEFDVWIWARRNEDKPHRCPGCHGIADREWGRRCGPRTVLRCPARCRLIWRYGARVSRREWETPSRCAVRRAPWQGW